MAETKQAGLRWTLADEPARKPRLAIFINYRRDDADDAAGRLEADLTEDPELQTHFDVFMDVKDIGLGQKYEEVITEKILACDVLLVVIGRHWLSITDKSGKPRLEQEDDLLRMEIEAAMNKDLTVIPILLRGVSMPSRNELPPSLAGLGAWQAHRMDYARWKEDLRELVEWLDRLHAERAEEDESDEERAQREREAAERARRARRRRQVARIRNALTRPATLGVAALLVLALVATIVLWPGPGGGWANVSDGVPATGEDARMNAIASVPNATLPYLAGGRLGSVGALWTSEDGQTWAPAASGQFASSVGAGTAINLIVAPRRRNVIAIGQEFSAPGETDVAVWRSQDGQAEEWERVSDDDLGGSGRQVASTARRVTKPTERFLLLGGYEGLQDDGRALMWRAPTTAEVWERIEDDSFEETEASGINRILCFPADEECNTIVALGWSTEGGDEDATVWTSATGASGSWTRHEIQATGDQRMTDAAHFDGRLVAVGFEVSADGSEADAAAWLSGEGINWSRVTGLASPGFQRADVVVTPVTEEGGSPELIAAGSQRAAKGAPTDAAVWTSGDGEAWTSVAPADVFGGPGDQDIVSVVARRGPIIAVGGNDGAPGIWCQAC